MRLLDLVVSGAGTMNREAAALGVPVYSIFRGNSGRSTDSWRGSVALKLLESRDEVRAKLRATKRPARAPGGG